MTKKIHNKIMYDVFVEISDDYIKFTQNKNEGGGHNIQIDKRNQNELYNILKPVKMFKRCSICDHSSICKIKHSFEKISEDFEFLPMGAILEQVAQDCIHFK